jgi:alkyl-hydroperoxide reductase/thiol specific antioxidant family protein
MQQKYSAVQALDAEVVAIGQGTAVEAQRVCQQLGAGYPCLGDPGKDSYRAFGLPRGGWREILIEPIRAGNEAVRKGHRVSLRGSLMRHSDWFQLPGLAVVDRAGIVRYLHRSRHAGDLPPMADVLAAVARI